MREVAGRCLRGRVIDHKPSSLKTAQADRHKHSCSSQAKVLHTQGCPTRRVTRGETKRPSIRGEKKRLQEQNWPKTLHGNTAYDRVALSERALVREGQKTRLRDDETGQNTLRNTATLSTRVARDKRAPVQEGAKNRTSRNRPKTLVTNTAAVPRTPG